MDNKKRIKMIRGLLRDSEVIEMDYLEFVDWIFEDGGHFCGLGCYYGPDNHGHPIHDHDNVAQLVEDMYDQLFSGGVFKGGK